MYFWNITNPNEARRVPISVSAPSHAACDSTTADVVFPGRPRHASKHRETLSDLDTANVRIVCCRICEVIPGCPLPIRQFLNGSQPIIKEVGPYYMKARRLARSSG